MDKTSLGDRMKVYEAVTQTKLMRRTPVIVRIDGKSFHTFTRGCDKPFDKRLINCMRWTTEVLVEKISGCVFGYTQSDEISLLLIDYMKLETQPWFDNKLQKIVSVAASMATAVFNQSYVAPGDPYAMFDARAYNIPREEVVNYFIWRQQDWTRNSVQMLARSEYSAKQCHKKNNSELQDMLMLEKGINWNDLDTILKRGTSVYKTADGGVKADLENPIFTQDRDFIGRFVYPEDEES